MTRFIHDQFSKQYLTELFTPYGEVEMSKDITSEVRQIDVFFTPTSPENIEELGLLGKMGIYAASVIFEPFRNAVSKSEIRSCMGKLFDIHAEIERQSKRNDTRINETELPHLWIFTPTASEDILAGCNATVDVETWGQGVYLLGQVLKTGIVVIHQLPSTPETVFLRVLGRGKVQRQAVEELEALAKNNPQLENVIKLVNDLIAMLSARQQKEKDIDQDDRELIMKLSEMYQQLLEELKEEQRQEGRQEGREEGEIRERRAMVESILQVRFGAVDPELANIIDQVIAMSREEFTPLLLNLSRADLLARFTK
ncbi:hypothetical protein A0J48_018420 [Sphaerospermopsis aphanizomenoides BCCUSP55]|uniref:hypothetical protein n=1 Tax=Sphaerospermopsis aphanizomenoides TaxID=459663 RepID=UPI000B1C8E90|nr:hypothetical protein [Sphaerospermopsis aphanizomenoides]MBK1989484.1 hypothetical protein [Sphaerospermopsis aphanizomenoides BCCUSP55]